MTVRWKPVTDRSAWRPEDLKQDRSWQFRLTKDQVEELEQALKDVKMKGLTFEEITAEDFPLPSLAETVRDLLLEIRDGRGIATLSGGCLPSIATRTWRSSTGDCAPIWGPG